MSSEERQRILRRAGGNPAEAEKEHGAQTGNEDAARQDAAERAEGEAPPTEAPTPLAEDADGPPRPRR